jgi:hypothetical protein
MQWLLEVDSASSVIAGVGHLRPLPVTGRRRSVAAVCCVVVKSSDGTEPPFGSARLKTAPAQTVERNPFRQLL